MAEKSQFTVPIWADVNARLEEFSAQLHLSKTRVLGTVLLASTAAFAIPRCYANYQNFLATGPSALPQNALGWAINWFLRLRYASMETLNTKLYNEPWTDKYAKNIPAKDAEVNRTRFLADLPQRGTRPVVAPFVVPQREQYPVKLAQVEQLQSQLLEGVKDENKATVNMGISKLEGHYTALFAKDSIKSPHPAHPHHNEICHIHLGADNSAHCSLSYADAKEVIEKGWGERHPLDGSYILGYGYVLLYAPRNEAELATMRKMMQAGVQFMTAMA